MKALYRPRWPLLGALIAGVALLVLLAYVPSRHSAQAPAVAPVGYVEGTTGAPATVNPLFAGLNEADADLSSLIFSSLVRLAADGSVEAGLADLPTITPDGRIYIFQLRQGLVWQDGVPLTAQDVAFTISLIQDTSFQGDPTLRDLFRGVQVAVRDDRSVTTTLPASFAPFLARLAGVGILPQHLLRGVAAGELASAPFNKRPVGSGPFRLLEVSSQRALLTPFAGYYLGRPRLQRLELRFYQDEDALLRALHDGDVDGAFFRQPLSPDGLKSIDKDVRWVRRPLHGTAYSLVYLNRKLAPAFGDSHVRQALELGLDRQAVIQDALYGQALLQDSPISRDLWAYVPSPQAYGFDAKAAAGLLDAAGWQMQNGVRAKGGATLEFNLSTSDDPVQVGVAQEIAREWEPLGVHAVVKTSPAGQFVDDVLLPRAFQAALVNVDPGPDPDPYPFWHSTQIVGTGRNLASFADATADRLLEHGRQTTVASDRQADYTSFQQIFAANIPAVLLFTPQYQYVVSADVKGLNPGLLVTPSARFMDVYGWYIVAGTGG